MAVPAHAATMLSDYEKLRQDRIAENKRKIEELGLANAAQDVKDVQDDAAPARKPRAPRAPKAEVEIDPENLRRSGRERAAISYKEEDMYPELPRACGPRGPRGPPRIVDEAEVEELRRKHGREVGSEDAEEEEAPKKGRKAVDSGKGVRVQGGRVYDSKFGVTCHWCRQKTLEDHVTCTSAGCGKGRRLATTFCKMCLRNRHGEDVTAAAASGQWVCPGCRGSCGKGCVSCCNCGPCRKKLELEPTRQVVGLAKQAGFNNVHDYLVHIVTGETCEQITERKLGFPWGKWLGETEEDWLGRPANPPAQQEEEEAGAGPSSEKAAAKKAAKPKPKGRAAKRKSAAAEADEEQQQEEEMQTAKKPRKGGRGKKAAATPATVATPAAPPPTPADQESDQEGEESEPEASPASSSEEEEEEQAPPQPVIPEGLELTRKQRKQLELGLITLDTILAQQAAKA